MQHFNLPPACPSSHHQVAINTNIFDLREYLNHIIASTNMTCLTPLGDTDTVSSQAPHRSYRLSTYRSIAINMDEYFIHLYIKRFICHLSFPIATNLFWTALPYSTQLSGDYRFWFQFLGCKSLCTVRVRGGRTRERLCGQKGGRWRQIEWLYPHSLQDPGHRAISWGQNNISPTGCHNTRSAEAVISRAGPSAFAMPEWMYSIEAMRKAKTY